MSSCPCVSRVRPYIGPGGVSGHGDQVSGLGRRPRPRWDAERLPRGGRQPQGAAAVPLLAAGAAAQVGPLLQSRVTCFPSCFTSGLPPPRSDPAERREESIFTPNTGGGCRLRDGVLFHMFVSSSPCGDARLNCPYERQAACELFPMARRLAPAEVNCCLCLFASFETPQSHLGRFHLFLTVKSTIKHRSSAKP